MIAIHAAGRISAGKDILPSIVWKFGLRVLTWNANGRRVERAAAVLEQSR